MVPPFTVERYFVQNWTITPTVKPAENFTLVLTGVADANLSGRAEGFYQTVILTPDDGPAIRYALTHFPAAESVFHPEIGSGHELFADQAAVFVALSSILDEGSSSGVVGFAVNSWNLIGNSGLPQAFAGIEVQVGIVNDHAQLVRLSYHITLVGRIQGRRPLATFGQAKLRNAL
jgi:hypothetical protein